MAEALEKGTLLLLKKQVRQPGLRAKVPVEVNAHGLKGPRSPRVQSLSTSQFCQLTSIQLLCGNSPDIQDNLR